MIEIATCSFGEYRPEMGYPIRTSTGAPKWFTFPYMTWENVFPRFHWKELPYDEFKRRYVGKLDDHGPDKLRGDLQFMAEEYAKLNGGEVRPLVLLCYEKLSKGEDNWCHRTMLADWIHQNLNMDVAELGAKLAPLEPDQTLF